MNKIQIARVNPVFIQDELRDIMSPLVNPKATPMAKSDLRKLVQGQFDQKVDSKDFDKAFKSLMKDGFIEKVEGSNKFQWVA